MNGSNLQLKQLLTWLTWAVLQLLILIVMAWRIPLSSGMEQPVENTALVAMVCVQLITAATMGRGLLRDGTTAMTAIGLAIPMLVVATRMANESMQIGIATIAGVMVWLGAMATIGSIGRTAVRVPLSTIVLIGTAGCPLLLYLSWEFGRKPIHGDGWIAMLSPILGVASPCIYGTIHFWPFILPILIIGVGMAFRMRKKKNRTQQTPSVPATSLKGLVG